MKATLFRILIFAGFVFSLHATEFHVAINGNDIHTGTKTEPLRTIQRAADLAQPADFITVHQGVYRERINPPRGGKSARKRIVYQAARGEQVDIKGSEVIKGWPSSVLTYAEPIETASVRANRIQHLQQRPSKQQAGTQQVVGERLPTAPGSPELNWTV
jgi:Protein of unknown function (DUF1565)